MHSKDDILDADLEVTHAFIKKQFEETGYQFK
jgi:hypothetical protein